MFSFQSNDSKKGRSDSLLARVGRGDAGAMEECIETYGNMVWGIVKKYSFNHSDSEDLVQEVFSELWSKADRFDPNKAGESTFIGLLTRRRAIDSVRKRSRQPEIEPISEAIEDLIPSPCNSMKSIDHQIVLEAVKELPSDTQSLFKFHFESGMTHQEIASQTGIPLGTIKTRLRSGLLQLRKQLGQDQPNENI